MITRIGRRPKATSWRGAILAPRPTIGPAAGSAGFGEEPLQVAGDDAERGEQRKGEEADQEERDQRRPLDRLVAAAGHQPISSTTGARQATRASLTVVATSPAIGEWVKPAPAACTTSCRVVP